MRYTQNINLPIVEDNDLYSKEINNLAFEKIDEEIQGLADIVETLDSPENSIADIKKDINDIKSDVVDINEQLDTIVQINFVEYGADKTGTIDNTQIINNIINKFSEKVLVTVPKGNYLINNNINIPSNISFKFDVSGAFKTGKNVKVTINGNVYAGNHTIFIGDGLVDIHLSDTPITLSWYSGNSFNEKWNKIRQTLEKWRSYELIVPKPYPNQEGAKQLSETDTNWWAWKLTEPWVLDDNSNQAIIYMYGELTCEGIVSTGLLIDDVEKPENIVFPHGITIRGTNNTDNYFSTGMEIRGCARLLFNGKVDIQYCNYGLIMGGSNQKREIGQTYFDYLHIAFIKNRHIIIEGGEKPVIGNRFRDIVLERVINDNQDCITIKGNCKNNIFDCIQYLTGTDDGTGKDARDLIIIQSTDKGYPIANEIRKVYGANNTGCGVKIGDLSNGVQNKVEDTIIGYINCIGGTGIDINYCKGTRLICASNRAMTHRIRSNAEYSMLTIGNRSGNIVDEGSFTLINNLVNVGKTNELPNTIGSKIGNLVRCDGKIYLRVSETGNASSDFILLSN